MGKKGQETGVRRKMKIAVGMCIENFLTPDP
jgi:hypothetical protein